MPTAQTQNEIATSNPADIVHDPYGDIDEGWLGYEDIDDDQWVAAIGYHYGQARKASVEIGKLLIRRKRGVGHGGFLRLLERIDMGARTAQYHMANAAFAYAHPKIHEQIIGATRKRRLEVAALPEDILKKLEETGEAGGYTITEIISGSTSYDELRKSHDAMVEKVDTLQEKLTERETQIRDLKAEVYNVAQVAKNLAKHEPELRKQLQPFVDKIRAAHAALDAVLEQVASYGYDADNNRDTARFSAGFEREIALIVEEIEISAMHTKQRYLITRYPDTPGHMYAELIRRADALPDDRRPANVIEASFTPAKG